MSIEAVAFQSTNPTPEKQEPLPARRETNQIDIRLSRIAMHELEQQHDKIIGRLIAPDSAELDEDTRIELREKRALIAHKIAQLRVVEWWDIAETTLTNWNIAHYEPDTHDLVRELQPAPADDLPLDMDDFEVAV